MMRKDSERCTGCTACACVCPREAISMKPDREGFLIPVVNDEKCIGCRICEEVCHLNVDDASAVPEMPVECFAAYNVDDPVRYNSASGGIFPAIARNIIEADGFVCGCILDDGLRPVHIVSNDHKDIARMQGSKYVQSDLKDCFETIGKLLCTGKNVLFSGTSCQVAGLKSYLAQTGISAEKLLTLDIICHGTPSPRVWMDYVAFYEKKTHRHLKTYGFRSKEGGWGAQSTHHSYQCVAESTKSVCDRSSLVVKLWNKVFGSDFCLRSCCYTCKYSVTDKPSDITIGDFWGIEKINPKMDDGKGCSCVIVHTQKGLSAFCESDGIKYDAVSLADIAKKNRNLSQPTPCNPKRLDFWTDYEKNGFQYVAKEYFGYSSTAKLKNAVKTILFKLRIKKKI